MTYKTRSQFVNAAFQQTQRPFTRKVISLTTAITDRVVELAGDFLYIDQASTGYVTIELNTAQAGAQDPITLAAGGAIECDFANFKITAPAQLNKSITLIVGNGARIKGGANVNADSSKISVVDGGLIRVMDQQSFLGTASKGAVVGQYSYNQLFNPAASGKNLILQQFCILTPTAGVIQTGAYETALTTNSTSVQNKYLSGSSPVGQVRTQANAAPLAPANGLQFYVQANISKEWKFSDSVVVPPGQGFFVLHSSTNVDLTTCFEWFEK